MSREINDVYAGNLLVKIVEKRDAIAFSYPVVEDDEMRTHFTEQGFASKAILLDKKSSGGKPHGDQART